MKEKKHVEKTVNPGGGDSPFAGVPDPTIDNNVNVSSGPYFESLPVSGTTAGEVRRKFSDRFDIDSQAQAIVNGKAVGDDYLLTSGENLMFVRHAGEKGSTVMLVDDQASVVDSTGYESSLDHRMPIPTLLRCCGPGISTGDAILPSGIKSVLSRGSITLWVWEQPPRVHKLSWIAKDSPKPFGRGTTYRDVRIALPYLIIVAVFNRDNNGLPELVHQDECFFRNSPLKSLDDELLYPGLLNCSKFRVFQVENGSPLSWICTQNLKTTKLMNSPKPGDRFQAGFEAVRYCLLETSFNLSSEHHEGNSWYSESKKVDPRIATIEDWEENTQKDPLFVLDVPWIPTKHSVRQLSERIFKKHSGGSELPKTADDIARIIINS